MTTLVVPTVRLHESWAAAVAEFDSVPAMQGAGLWNLPQDEPLDTTRAGCARVVEMLAELADTSLAPPPGMVHCDHYWITDGQDGHDGAGEGQVVGFLALRHTLNDFLFEQGGHVGYSVRPSRRREGHASRALRLSVGRAADLGIRRLLVTCDDDNRASAATIEACGGELEDRRQGKLRYWIDTAS
ncbi:GNAT family N-acetyltransferase [Nocardioides nanhaiensis]|uniref:GNAT family N-acetyltransferase n=1 Tax=Nocardioides nanhaiensis TaxID=1476871 RepID=A0ABP8VVL9_9ACTN